MARNLLGHLIDGKSAIVVGGPAMGKTTLLRQVAEEIAAHAAQPVMPVMIDLTTDTLTDLERRLSDRPGGPGGPNPVSLLPAILLIDGCERLLPDPSTLVHQVASKVVGPSLRAAVWAGGINWGEWAMGHRSEFGSPIRYYPLIVLPPKEARPFLKRHWSADVPSSELEWVVELSGGHPYLLSRMAGQPTRNFDAFFTTLWDIAGSPAERHVLMQLIEAGSWVLLQELHNEAGGSVPKAVLDRLAIVGLINRT
jgi:hypothetical protein